MHCAAERTVELLAPTRPKRLVMCSKIRSCRSHRPFRRVRCTAVVRSDARKSHRMIRCRGVQPETAPLRGGCGGSAKRRQPNGPRTQSPPARGPSSGREHGPTRPGTQKCGPDDRSGASFLCRDSIPTQSKRRSQKHVTPSPEPTWTRKFRPGSVHDHRKTGAERHGFL